MKKALDIIRNANEQAKYFALGDVYTFSLSSEELKIIADDIILKDNLLKEALEIEKASQEYNDDERWNLRRKYLWRNKVEEVLK